MASQRAFAHSKHPRTSSSAAATAWEDDAWKIDSDDEDFVKASRATLTAKSNRLANGGAGKSAQQAQASTQSIAQQQQQQQTPNRASTSSLNPGNGHWMLVERSGSAGSVQATKPVPSTLANASDAQAAGSALDDQEDEEKARTSLSRHNDMLAAIRGDTDTILNDPVSILARLQDDGQNGQRRAETLNNTKGEGPSSNQIQEARRSSATRTNLIDTTNAIVAVDGIVTNLPASSDQFDARSLDVPPGSDVVVLSSEGVERKRSVRSERRKAGFLRCLREESIPMDELRTLSWAGVPDDLRPAVWMLLLGYAPPNRAIRAQTLARKRAEYVSGVRNAFQRGTEELDQAIWHQIHIDVPRTNPGIRLWQREATQRSLERILYVWAIRHPASGYVQGINDLATPFFEVFLGAYITSDAELYDVGLLPPAVLEAIEADTFWCLSKLLDGIQDNYIFAQPGIQRQVRRMAELVARINPTLHAHFEDQSVEYMQFAFRWMNCLLMRELSVRNIVRMWDSYLAEGPDAFSEFHLFVCAAFLDRWSEELLKMDFQGIIMFLQSLPTQSWSPKETELLLADAFVKKSLFGGTAHLTN